MTKRTTATLFVALLLGTTGLAYGVSRASAALSTGHTPRTAAHAAPTRTTEPVVAAPHVAKPTPRPAVTHKPKPKPQPEPRLVSGPRLVGPGDDGAKVRALQARLRQIAWYAGDVTDHYGAVTTAAVRGFQAKRGIPVTGYVDARTMRRLEAMTHAPTTGELQNKITPMGNTPGRLDARCLTGRALCIDKTSRTLRWVVDGRVLKTVDVRFGSTISNTPTREGLFHVYWKDADHVSKEFGSAMPWAMFFSRGQAVHYSSDFAARGYAGASHGCVNVRDYDGVKWLFNHVAVGDKAVVYWS